MSTSINLPVLLAQLPHLQELAGAEKARPETQAAFSEQLVAEKQKEEKDQVQKVEEQDKLSAAGERPGRERPGRQDPKRRKPKPEQPEEDDDSRSSSPWAGNILNLKV